MNHWTLESIQSNNYVICRISYAMCRIINGKCAHSMSQYKPIRALIMRLYIHTKENLNVGYLSVTGLQAAWNHKCTRSKSRWSALFPERQERSADLQHFWQSN